ncbi:chlorophyll a/b-binding protein domain-containing protein [Ochromonadaceae sp. CCMP2298]|nr:chlorophyll a/b-binding protein domain-containing protein [Ochromonadaceae sp. CCMP2298]
MLWFATAFGFDRRIGATKPLGYFDPLGFSNNKPITELIRLREAELKHCRWGMVAAVAIPATEIVTHQPAIYALDDTGMFIPFLAIALAETRSLKLGWKNPFKNASNLFVMDEYYKPGDLGINGPFIKKDNAFIENAELNNGRLAMIAALGMITQEYIYDYHIFN